MKKIINGKKYDTDTAILYGSYDNGSHLRENRFCEQLYRKKTGEFFLYGKGGPETKYAVSCSQGKWSEGENIEPLTFVAARTWAERYLKKEEYETIFGKVDESGERKTVSYSLPASLVEKVKRAAAEKGIGPSEFVESALTAAVEQREEKK